jgi:hypothetical protein
MSLDLFLKQAVSDAIDDVLSKRLESILRRIQLSATIPTGEDNSLNRKQAAQYLGLAKTTLAIMACEKRGPTYVKIGRTVSYRKRDLDQFLEDNRCLIGRRGRPPVRTVVVERSGSIHGGPGAQRPTSLTLGDAQDRESDASTTIKP